MSLLTGQWAAQGHDVTVITVSSATTDFYDLHPAVRRVALDLEVASSSFPAAIGNNVRKLRGLRRAVASASPDVVISFVNKLNILVVLSCIGLRVPVIVSERTYPPAEHIGPMWALLRRLTYSLASAVVVQSQAASLWAEQIVPRRRVHVVPNGLGAQFCAPPNSLGRQRLVLGVGRLGEEKGFDVLVQAFSSLATRHSGWALLIIGRGPKEAHLKALAGRLSSAGTIRIQDGVRDPERYYRSAGLFVLPSRYEGFPNALLEAMACGCAVIAMNCPGGTSEIVRDGVDGVLVTAGDVAGLERQMDRLMGDEAERNRLGTRATEVTARFGMVRALALWDRLISDVLEKRGS